MNELDVVWAAGFFDGEGSIGVYRRKGRGGHQLTVSLTQKNRVVLEEFKAIVGVGNLYRQRGEIWAWQTSSLKAAGVLALLLPYLRTRRRTQAILAIAFQARKNPRNTTPLSIEELAERASFAYQISDLAS